MPFSFRYFAERDLLVETLWGDVTLADLTGIREARRNSSVPHPVAHCVVDVRDAHVKLTPQELRAHETSAQPFVPGERIAVLADDSRTTAMALMWAPLVRDQAKVEVFSTPEAAYAWLGVAYQGSDLAIP